MKHTAIFFLIVLMLACIFAGCKREDTGKDSYSGSVVNVYSTPEMYDVAAILVNEFSMYNPDIDIKVNQENRSAVITKLTQGPSLALVSGELPDEDTGQNLWKEVIGRDIIVPVFNVNNPYSEELLAKGITQSDLAGLLSDEELVSWSELGNSPEGTAISLCIVDDPAVLEGLRKFTGLQELKSERITFYGPEDLINSIESDPYALGLCRLRSLFADGSGEIPVTLKILPIDKNDNGKVDYVENIYNDYESISRGVWIGKYPRELINNIYSITAQRPSGENELAFLKWVITDGQQHLGNYGYNNLIHNERLAKLSLLEDLEISIEDNVSYAQVRDPLSFYIYFPLIVTACIIVFFVIIFMLQREKEKLIPVTKNLYASGSVFNEESIRSPEGLYYDRTHTWVYMEEDGLVKIGIDDFLQHITGPLTRVKLKSKGERVKKGKHILSIIQEGKQLEVYSPITGIIREQNQTLEADSSVINTSPYKEGWVYKIEPTNWLAEIQFMILGKKYKEWLRNEFTRLKEFLSEYIKPASPKYAYVMQDGGELKGGVLKDLGPELWEDFQTNFMDVSV